MSIQWYPGHMHKAQKEIAQNLDKMDVLIEVLDARIPFSSENPLIARIRKNKPCLKILNKSDLADPEKTKAWQAYWEQSRDIKTLATTLSDSAKTKTIPDLCAKLVPEKAASVKKMRAMIVGIPNVGKSTIINILAGRTVAKTGNEPAVTKTQQQIHINDDLLLFDTPGILWPKQEYEKSSYRLAATGAIKSTAMDFGDVAFFTGEYLLEAYPEALKEYYGLSELPETELEFFELIGRKRGCLGAGGRVDLHKISEIFINDYRAGNVGKITLEMPLMVEKEKAEQEKINAQKAKEKKERLEQFKKKKKR